MSSDVSVQCSRISIHRKHHTDCFWPAHCMRDDFGKVVTKQITNHACKLKRSFAASLKAGTDVMLFQSLTDLGKRLYPKALVRVQICSCLLPSPRDILILGVRMPSVSTSTNLFIIPNIIVNLFILRLSSRELKTSPFFSEGLLQYLVCYIRYR